MTTPKQWLSYWRKSLLDSLKAEIDLDKYTVKIQIPNFSVFSDKLTDCLADVNKLIDAEEKRINQKQYRRTPQDPDWVRLNEVSVLIAPFRLNPLPQRQSFVHGRKSLYPFWYPAILGRDGGLSIPPEVLPFIPRAVLTPIADERTEYIIGDTEVMDRACAVGDIKFENYKDYIGHILGIFQRVTDVDMSMYAPEDFVTDFTAHIIVPDETIGAAMHLVELYDNLILEDALPPLLYKLMQLDHKAPRLPLELQDWIPANVLHLGQMKSSFALSYSQRKSLYTILANPGERVFAVNGPPGTGKTTLLQSVVANAMVEGVLSGQPPVILACSANNQAVTNIIDSFTKKDDEEAEIRWLPNVTGYATYLPSTAKDKLEHINYMKLKGEGLFSRLETPEYIEQARTEYVKRASAFWGDQITSIGDVIKRLRERIISSQQLLKEVQRLWAAYLEVLDEFEQEYLPTMATSASYQTEEGLLSIELLEQDKYSLEVLTEKVLDYFRHEGMLRKIGCWMGFGSSMRNRHAELNVIFRRSIVRPGIFPIKITGSADVLTQIDRLIALSKKVRVGIEQWLQWQETLAKRYPEQGENFFRHTPSKDSTNFYDMLDTTIRYQAFVDAVHYWEGRWIEETSGFLMSSRDDKKKRGQEVCKTHWRRRAMLTPCFVSTFYMAPKFFDYGRYLGEDCNGTIFGNPPLTDFIDWLIVDEAGQVPPEVGAGVFALARKAVVVGDVMQIEPVWNIRPKVDMGNLKKVGLIAGNEKVGEDIYEPKGFLSSSGSILQMAQNACSFAEEEKRERGMMLVEHRRCYNQIIEYCNELAYQGLLLPLRGPANEDNLYPPMLCIHVEGRSSQSKDRHNDSECDAICQWLIEQKSAIEQKYIDGKDYQQIEDIVGILTPFVGQKNHLKRALRKAGFDTERFKLGTVHALQGAERPIVLFSTVYGPGDVGTMFFDYGNKPNMLNVAVSRAKDSFIVFANTKIFNSQSNSPSGILARHLKFYNINND